MLLRLSWLFLLVLFILGLNACYIVPPGTSSPVTGSPATPPSQGDGAVTNPNTDLIGRWDLYSFSATDGVVSISINYPLAMLIFRADGTGSTYYNTPSGGVEEDSFRWQRTGNTVWIGSGAATLSGGILTLSDTLYESGSVIYVTATFHRI